MSWNCPSVINDTDQQLVIHRTIFVNKTIIFSTILACTAHSGNVNGMSFTMDGLHLVTSGTDNRIRLWNIETGRNTLVNYGKIQNETRKGLQFAVSCWCKSDLIYIPDEYCNIQVYEMFTGRKIDTLRGHLQQVNCCVFHPDYQELYSGGNDRNVLIWEPELDGSYDNYLKERSSKKQTQSRSFVSRIAATADSWSSDEETWHYKYWSRHLQSAMVSFKDVTFWLHLQILTLQCRSKWIHGHECSYSNTYIDIISLWRSLMKQYVKKKIEKQNWNKSRQL